MRLGITGTYSSGKTLTSLIVSHLLAMSRTEARTMREILPAAAPGKTLEEVTSTELIRMIVERHTERVLHEHLRSPNFVSDGCSLQEWIYGSVRVRYGVNPNISIDLAPDESVQRTPELVYFEQTMLDLGKLFKRHVKSSFDMFVHLANELPLAKDGHRPVNELFRSASDELLKETFDEIGISYVVVSGSLEERCERIMEVTGRQAVIPFREAEKRASAEYANLIM